MRRVVYFAPALERLEEVWPGKGEEIREILHGKVKLNKYASVKRLIDQSPYYHPTLQEKIMTALNEVIEGFGVEYIPGKNGIRAEATYINMGDTYNATLLIRFGSGLMQLTTYGDFVERNRL